MEKETIKLSDFLNEVIKSSKDFKDFGKSIKPSEYSQMVCPKCGSSSDAKFCKYDGAEIEIKTYSALSEDSQYEILRLFNDFNDNMEMPDSFPYEFVEGHEQRGDGSGYEMHYVFKRKSDGKFFYFYSYDGRADEVSLEEVLREAKQIVKKTWDFECKY